MGILSCFLLTFFVCGCIIIYVNLISNKAQGGIFMSNKKVSMEKTTESINKPRYIGGYISTDLVEVMLRAFRHALNNIKVMKADLASIRLDSNVADMEFNSFKYRLNKYQIFGSDCAWRSTDPRLQHIIDSIDMCNRLLLNKATYTIGDVIYLSNTLDEIKAIIEQKTDELNELYSL